MAAPIRTRDECCVISCGNGYKMTILPCRWLFQRQILKYWPNRVLSKQSEGVAMIQMSSINTMLSVVCICQGRDRAAYSTLLAQFAESIRADRGPANEQYIGANMTACMEANNKWFHSKIFLIFNISDCILYIHCQTQTGSRHCYFIACVHSTLYETWSSAFTCDSQLTLNTWQLNQWNYIYPSTRTMNMTSYDC